MKLFSSVRNRNRWMLLLLAILFIGPALLARVLYDSHWKPQSLNHGHLLNPPIAFQNYQKQIPKNLQGKWLLLHVLKKPCEKDCQQNIYKTRQIRIALGKERERLIRVIVTAAETPDPNIAKILPRYKNELFHIAIAKSQIMNMLKQSPASSDIGLLFVVDPDGNIILSYQPTIMSEWLLQDLKRLLKVSRIG